MENNEEEIMELYYKQKRMLKDFLSAGAIDRKQYDTSINGLREKMGVLDLDDEEA